MPFVAGETLTAAKLNADLKPLFAWKPVNEGVVNSTAGQADDHLFVIASANTTYMFEASIGTLANSGVDGFLTWAYPSGNFDFGQHNLTFVGAPGVPTGDGDWNYRQNSGGGFSASLNWGGGTGGDAWIAFSGLLRTGGSGGEFRLYWAQLVSNASTVWVLQGSWIRLRKVA